jgi:hypothetical protein
MIIHDTLAGGVDRGGAPDLNHGIWLIGGVPV